MEVLHQPGESRRLGDWLKDSLAADWPQFRAAVAFVKRSGVKHIADRLAALAKTAHVEIIVGVDHQGTSYEGLKALLAAVSSNGRIVVYHNRLPHTFHPKLYLFKSERCAEVAVGSGNLTEGGLFTNYEVSALLRLDLSNDTDAHLLQTVEHMLDGWSTTPNMALALDDDVLARLVEWRLVCVEAHTASPSNQSVAGTAEQESSPFASMPVRQAPAIGRDHAADHGTAPVIVAPPVDLASADRFVMTLQQTDVGIGQTGEGTSRRSPETLHPPCCPRRAPFLLVLARRIRRRSNETGQARSPSDRASRRRIGASQHDDVAC